MALPSVMVHKFSELPSANCPRSAFDQTWTVKSTFDADYIIPVGNVIHVMPGDTLNMDATFFARLATPIYPLMDNMYLDVFWFFVPYRIVWDNFRKFMGERATPAASISYTVPTVDSAADGFVTGTLADYFGLPVDSTQLSGETVTVMSLPFRGYNLIWNEFFRDQGVQDSVTVDVDDGPDTLGDYVLLKRCKKHDYFTSARPWPQRGDAASISLTGNAAVKGIGKGNNSWNTNDATVYETGESGTTTFDNQRAIAYSQGANSYFYVEEDANNSGFPGIFADLSTASSVTINDLRESIATQQLLERDARYGTRYTEIIESHYGVTNPMEAYRPEFLGGSSQAISFTPIAQTSATSGTDYQGSLSAFATATSHNNGFVKSFTEHGMVYCLVNVRADITYQNGLNRFWSKSTRYDFYWPSFAHLGEQSVTKGEIYTQGTSTDDETWAYQERWSEYRYTPSQITGQLRSSHATTLHAWHLSEDFGSLPVLSGSFVVSNTPMARVVAAGASPHFIFDSFFKCRSVRPMPLYSTPGLARL